MIKFSIVRLGLKSDKGRSKEGSKIPIIRIISSALLLSILFGGASVALAADNIVSASKLDLSAYRGKVVYLDFWASWCGPCRLSFPFMNTLQWSFPNKKLVVLTVNMDHDRVAAQKFINRYGGGLPVYLDPKGALASKYGVATMPTSILIGKDGKVRYVHKGFLEGDEPTYRQQIAELLHQQ